MIRNVGDLLKTSRLLSRKGESVREGDVSFYCPKDSPKESFATFGADYLEDPGD